MRRTALVAAGLAICLCSALLAEQTEPPAATPEKQEIAVEFAENPCEEMLIEQALLAQANVIKNCRVTYYCAEPYEHICGLGLGITSTGQKCVPDAMVAVDKSVIPLHSQVLVDFGGGEIYCYVAEDVGGAIKGNHIDIMVSTHEEALRRGSHTATVYWVPPMED